MDRLESLLQELRDARFHTRGTRRGLGYVPQEVDDLLDHVELELATFLNTTDVTRHEAGHEEEGE